MKCECCEDLDATDRIICDLLDEPKNFCSECAKMMIDGDAQGWNWRRVETA